MQRTLEVGIRQALLRRRSKFDKIVDTYDKYVILSFFQYSFFSFCSLFFQLFESKEDFFSPLVWI